MNISEHLKFAAKVSSIFVIGIGTGVSVALSQTALEEAVQPVAEVSLDATTMSSTTTQKNQTSATAMSATVTSSTTVTISTTQATTTGMQLKTEITESITEPTIECQSESIETRTELDVVEVIEEAAANLSAGSLIRSNMRGTYYSPGGWNGYSSMGGSGRYLLDCSYGGDGYAKGSIASGYLYDILGYSSNGSRTAVWLEISGYAEMSGIYYLDDCSGADVIDFYYDQTSNCQFSYAGVVSVDAYYIN
jgi:hypothetical protein